MKNLLFIFTVLALFSCQSNTPVPSNLAGYDSITIPGSESVKVVKQGDDGKVVETGYILNGNKHGIWTTYSPENKIKTIANYIDGKKNGTYLELSSRGQIELLITYTNDEYDGPYGKYKFGRATEDMVYVKGQLDGEFKTYFNNGKIQKLVTFKNGKQDGPLKYYDEEGNVTLEYMYKNGNKVSGGIVE